MELIENGSDLADATADLKKGDSYYVDTEFESSRNGTRLSLIQVSRGEEIYLVDALKIRDLTPLGAALGRPEVTWITHAGLQDVDLLVPALDIAEPPALFDTQVAWALQGPEPSVSLSYLKFQLLGLRTMKTHQADDWIRRPLPESQLQYAAEDVEHLPEIEKLLKERLAKLDREALVPTICREQLWPKGEPVRPISLDSFRNAWQLGEKNQAVLRFLVRWYNDLHENAQRRAPSAKNLLAIASRMPRNAADLSRLKGIPRGWAADNAGTLIRQMKEAVANAHSDDFEPLTPPPYATFEEIRLDAWLGSLRAELCSQLQVAPELALPNRLVKEIKAVIEETGERQRGADKLEGWRKQLLGAPYEAYCASSED